MVESPKRSSMLLRAAMAALLLSGSASVMAQKQQLRPEVGKPLQEAQTALQSKNYKEALAKISEAEGAGKLTPYETYIVNRLRGAAAAGSGDYATAVKAFEAALASGQVPAEEKLTVIETIAKISYSGKNFPKAIEYIKQYQAAGGTKQDVLGLKAQALYLGGNYREAFSEIFSQVSALEKAGKTPTETQLQLLASCALKQNDMNQYTVALQRLAGYYPKKDYWLDLTLRTAGKPGFSDRLALDVYRLRFATGTLERPGDVMEAAQLALQAGLPGEAQKYVKAGFDAKLLGTGPDADRHNRLKVMVEKKVAEDKAILATADKQAATAPSGDPLVASGLNYVGYGEYEKGLQMMEEGIKKGQLTRPDHANLHLGYAYLVAGKKDQALKALRRVGGTDGAKDVARLWTIAARHPFKNTIVAAK